MKTFKFWEVIVIADCEGRSMKTLACFTTESEAEKFSLSDAGRDMYGQEGDVALMDYSLFETAEEAGAVSNRKLKREALAKLTPAERSALGFKEDS